MDISSRIAKYIAYKGLTYKKLEVLCKLGNGTLSKLSDKTRESTIDRIVDHCPDLNRTWLLTGEGSMLKETSTDAAIPTNNKDLMTHIVHEIESTSVNTELKERVKAVLAFVNLSASAFAKKINAKTPQTIYDLTSGKTRTISFDVLSKITSCYPSLSVEWLVTGEGSMLKEDATTSNYGDETAYAFNNGESGNAREERKVYLPLIPIEAIAGLPADDNIGVMIKDCEQYAVPEFSTFGAQYLIRVSGTSMLPKYNNGDILACRKIDSITFFQWGKVYVIDTRQGVLVKKVFPDDGNAENIICVSENKDDFPPFSLPKDEIRSLSIVIGRITLD